MGLPVQQLTSWSFAFFQDTFQDPVIPEYLFVQIGVKSRRAAYGRWRFNSEERNLCGELGHRHSVQGNIGLGAGFAKHADRMKEDGVDGEVLLDMDESDLDDIGFNKLQKKRLKKERKKLVEDVALKAKFERYTWQSASSENFFLAACPLTDTDANVLHEIIQRVKQEGGKYTAGDAQDKFNSNLEMSEEWFAGWKGKTTQCYNMLADEYDKVTVIRS